MPSKRTKLDARIEAAKEPETAPHQHAWEAGVLAALAHSANSDESDVPGLVLALPPDAFERSDHRAIFRAVKALRGQGEGIDATTVQDWLARQGETVAPADVATIWTASAPALPLVQTYVGKLAERARLKVVADTARAVAATADLARTNDTTANAADALAELQATVFDAARTDAVIGQRSLSEADVLDAFLLDLEARASTKGYVGLNTGFDHLNAVLNGLLPGLYIFAGPPGCGKTTFLKQLADQLAEQNANVAVLFLSFEQSAEELRIKSLARLSGVNSRDILKGRAGGKWTGVERAARDYRVFADRLHLVEADRDTTVGAIRLLAQSVRQRAKADRVVLVIDYLQIVPVESPKDFATTKDRVDWLCAELRRLARDLRSPVLAISSENRAAYAGNGKPTLAAFKESGGIEYSADVAGAFWTDKEAPRGDPGDRTVLLTLLKNRNGETAEIKWTFAPATASFYETGDVPTPLSYADTLKDSR
jgi:replicative DNA helicase